VPAADVLAFLFVWVEIYHRFRLELVLVLFRLLVYLPGHLRLLEDET